MRTTKHVQMVLKVNFELQRTGIEPKSINLEKQQFIHF